MREWNLSFSLIQDDQIRVIVRLKTHTTSEAVKKAREMLKTAGINVKPDYYFV